MARERRELRKEYLYAIIVGNYYVFDVFRVTDAAKQIYYIGSPQGHGGTRIADTEDELKKLLAAQVPILNDWLSKVK